MKKDASLNSKKTALTNKERQALYRRRKRMAEDELARLRTELVHARAELANALMCMNQPFAGSDKEAHDLPKAKELVRSALRRIMPSPADLG